MPKQLEPEETQQRSNAETVAPSHSQPTPTNLDPVPSSSQGSTAQSSARQPIPLYKHWLHVFRQWSAPPGSSTSESTAKSTSESTAKSTASPHFPLADWLHRHLLAQPWWQLLTNHALFVIAIGSTVTITVIASNMLTTADNNSESSLQCQSKITGRWQIQGGKLHMTETNNQVTGKYEYQNLNRGKITGEFSGTLNHALLNIQWQERSEREKSGRSGKGTLVFRNACREFYGSYGSSDNIDQLSNWWGTLVPTTSGIWHLDRSHLLLKS